MKAKDPSSLEKKKKRIILVDPHPVFRHGLSELINQQADLVTCGEADNTSAALRLVTSARPDIAIIALNLKKSIGIELIKDLHVQHRSLLVLVLSSYQESVYAERVLRAGGKGYIMKDAPWEQILQAIRRVLSGRVHFSQEIATKLLTPMVDGSDDATKSPIDRLSDRELEVFRLLGMAYATRQIAEMLHVSVKTVESYRENIKTKLNLDNSAKLIRKAVEWVQKAGLG